MEESVDNRITREIGEEYFEKKILKKSRRSQIGAG